MFSTEYEPGKSWIELYQRQITVKSSRFQHLLQNELFIFQNQIEGTINCYTSLCRPRSITSFKECIFIAKNNYRVEPSQQ